MFQTNRFRIQNTPTHVSLLGAERLFFVAAQTSGILPYPWPTMTKNRHSHSGTGIYWIKAPDHAEPSSVVDFRKS
ncbi:hypothetical protein KCU88_g6389, partial [Aureobasidium melanogenum]